MLVLGGVGKGLQSAQKMADQVVENRLAWVVQGIDPGSRWGSGIC